MQPVTILQRLVPILFEDESLLAVAKPSGLDTGAAPRESSNGLAELLAEHRHESLAPCNRLSRYDSGVLLLGKNPLVVREVKSGLKRFQVEQEYIALVHGTVPAKLSIDPVHGASRGKAQRRKPDSEKRRVKHSSSGSGAQRHTTVRVIQNARAHSLIRCNTTVETTHALRAQLRAVDLRLVGDHLHQASRTPRSAPACLHLRKITLNHPGNKSKMTVTCPLPGSVSGILEGTPEVERPIIAALTRRLPVLSDPHTDAYRLITGNAEDLPGLVAERFGDIVILELLEDHPRLLRSLPRVARTYRDLLGVRTVKVRRRVKERHAKNDAGAQSPRATETLLGQAVPDEVVIIERGLKFAIRPHEASVGLFLDQRDNRTRLREMAAGKDVLNLFAYTCGFSVAAAAGGAGSTVSVDLSPRHLEWGWSNFSLNGLELHHHQFIRSDATGYVRRAQRQGKEFDVIVLDPPSFAHGRKARQSFSIERDLASLITSALALLRSEGDMLVSTNLRRMSPRDLRRHLHEGAGGRGYEVVAAPRLPIDFAPDPDHAKSIWVHFE